MSKGSPPARHDWQHLFEELGQNAQDERLRRYYGAGMIDTDTPLANAPLMALDVETTGLDASHDAIVSLGLLPFDLERIYCKDARYWVVQPPEELSEESVLFHHITHSEVEKAPRMEAILGELLEAIAGNVLVVHYRHIERAFLDQAVFRYLGEHLYFPVIDTMELEARLTRQEQSARKWFRLPSLFKAKPVSIRLANSRTRYGLPAYRPHHALTDALATAELLQAQVSWHFDSRQPISTLWS